MRELTGSEIASVTWGEVIASTGIDDRQLRNAIDRGLLPIGVKRANRLMFTYRELFAVNVAASLTNNWLPISIAATVAKASMPSYAAAREFFSKVYLPAVAPREEFGEGEEMVVLGKRLQAARDRYGIGSPDLRLVCANAGDSVAIGLRSSDNNWTPEEGGLPLLPGLFPNELTTSLVQCVIRELLYNVGFYGTSSVEGDDGSTEQGASEGGRADG